MAEKAEILGAERSALESSRSEVLQAPTKDQALELLKDVQDPEMGMNIVDLGLIYEIYFQEGLLFIRMTLTSPWCPMVDDIERDVVERVGKLEGVDEVWGRAGG